MINSEFTADNDSKWSPEDSNILTDFEKTEWSKHADKLPTTKEGIEKLTESMPLSASHLNPESETFQALQAIADETDPVERALCFKSSGNAAYQMHIKSKSKKRLQDAYVYYTKAIDVKCEDDQLNSVLRVNRAMASMKQKNYRRVIDDCEISIKLQNTYVKAYLFAAKAAIAIEKWKECKKFAEQGLVHATEEKKETEIRIFNKYLKTSLTKIAIQEEVERKATEKRLEKQRREAELQQAIVERKLKISKPVFEYQEYIGDAQIRLDEEKYLHWPVVFLYPEAMQFDIIGDFNEINTLQDHLAMMFPPQAAPPAWDTQRKYHFDRLQVFYEALDTKEKIIVPLHKTLKGIISATTYSIPGIPTFSVELKS